MTAFEDRVRSGLEAAAGEYEPSPGLRGEVDRRVRRHRRGRIVTGVVGTVGALIFVAGLGVLLATDDEGNQNESTAATTLVGGWRAVEVLGLTMEVPETWWQQSFGPQCRIGYTGVLVGSEEADLEFERSSPASCSTAWRTKPASVDQVAVEVSTAQGGRPLGLDEAGDDTTFPLPSARVLRTADGLPALTIVVEDVELARLSVWVGPEASEADLAIARRIIESIRPT